MNGQNAKTNFPTSDTNTKPRDGHESPLSPKALSELLSTKLRKCCKDQYPSLTCLRLDADNSHIGVWQKRAGAQAGSDWVMRIELGKKEMITQTLENGGGGGGGSDNAGSGIIDEEDSIAMQMIEELLNWNYPTGDPTSNLQQGNGNVSNCL